MLLHVRPRATQHHAVRLDGGYTRHSRARRPLRRCCSTVCLMGSGTCHASGAQGTWYVGSHGRAFRCDDAESGTSTCGATRPVNLYNASILFSPHSSTTCWLRARQQASLGQDRCGSRTRCGTTDNLLTVVQTRGGRINSSPWSEEEDEACQARTSCGGLWNTYSGDWPPVQLHNYAAEGDNSGAGDGPKDQSEKLRGGTGDCSLCMHSYWQSWKSKNVRLLPTSW